MGGWECIIFVLPFAVDVTGSLDVRAWLEELGFLAWTYEYEYIRTCSLDLRACRRLLLNE